MAGDTSQVRRFEREGERERRKSFTLGAIKVVGDAFAVLAGALLFSILAEWFGMVFIWTEEGVTHSERMLTTELSYINRDFKAAILGSKPMDFAIGSAKSVDYWLFEATYFRDILAWGMRPGRDAGTVRRMFAKMILLTGEYIEAAINIVQLFGVRLAIALLSMPAFLLIGVAALTDGLAHRDLRRFTGAAESSFLYHRFKPWVKSAFISAWFIYLSMPIALHPNVIFIPGAVLFGLTLFFTSAMFKKTL